MYYQKMLAEQQKLSAKIQSIQNELEQLPEGSLITTRNGPYHKWYHLLDRSMVYIPKSRRSFAKQLARKKYLSLQLKNISNQKKAVDAYLKHRRPTFADADNFLITHEAFYNLLSDSYRPLSQELARWAAASYEKNTNHSEHLTHKTISGNLVRSKSEALIDTILHANKIPFRYECALILGDTKIFPDFTLRHPITGDIYYWEHFGMMDDPSYIKKAYSKLHLYTSNGIIPTIHLITTYETKDHPLTPDKIEKIIQEYFMVI